MISFRNIAIKENKHQFKRYYDLRNNRWECLEPLIINEDSFTSVAECGGSNKNFCLDCPMSEGKIMKNPNNINYNLYCLFYRSLMSSCNMI